VRRKIKRLRVGGAAGREYDQPTATAQAAAASPSANRDAFKGADRGPTPPKNFKPPVSAKPGDERDAPFKQNVLVNALAGAVFPGGGILAGAAQKKAYKDRQKFARKEGLYRDFYKANQFNPNPNKRTLKPNTKEGKAYLKEAGFGKRPKEDTRDDQSPQVRRVCPDGTLPPCVKPKAAADPAKPKTIQPQKFNFEFSQGGLSGGKRFGPPPKKGPRSHGICPHRPDGIRGVGAVEKGRGVKFVGVK